MRAGEKSYILITSKFVMSDLDLYLLNLMEGRKVELLKNKSGPWFLVT